MHLLQKNAVQVVMVVYSTFFLYMVMGGADWDLTFLQGTLLFLWVAAVTCLSSLWVWSHDSRPWLRRWASLALAGLAVWGMLLLLSYLAFQVPLRAF